MGVWEKEADNSSKCYRNSKNDNCQLPLHTGSLKQSKTKPETQVLPKAA